MKKVFYVVGVFFLMKVSISYGDEVIGYPGRVVGRCELLRKGVAEKIHRSAVFLKGDVIRTHQDGRVEVVLIDETVIKIGPNAEVNLSDFVLDEGIGRRKGIVKLIKGTIMTLFRKVYRGIKGEFSVETTTAVVGVRGTRFITSSYSPSQTEIIVLEGSVNVDTPFGSIVLEEGFITSVFEGQPPSPPHKFDTEKIEQFIRGIEPGISEEDFEGLIEPPAEGETFFAEDIYNRPSVEQTIQTGAEEVFTELGRVPVNVKVIFPWR